MSTGAATSDVKGKRSFWSRDDQRSPYLFISPFYILFTIFFLIPSVMALVLGFFRWSSVGAPEWFGLRNYQRLFGDPIFWLSVRNTIYYSAISLFVIVPLALLIAMALNSPRLKFVTFWRAVYFAPIVTSTVAISIVFRMLYNADYGLINAVLGVFGIEPVNWLGDTRFVKPAVMGIVIWRWTGLLSIYFLAGLQSISRDLYEAASIDGASARQKFLHITVPALRPITLFVCTIVLIGAMQIFDDPTVLFGTGNPGGPSNAGLSIVQYLYTRGIGQLLFGYASAVGVFLFVIIFVLSLLQFRVFRGFEND